MSVDKQKQLLYNYYRYIQYVQKGMTIMKSTVKRMLILLLSGALAVSVFTECDDNTPEQIEKADEIDEVDNIEEDSDNELTWSADAENHWHTTEENEKLDIAAHIIEDGICTVCSYEIIDYEDGTFDVIKYDDNGNEIYCAYYDGAELMSVTETEYTYDENGNILAEASYTDGVLTYESEYTLDEDDYPQLSKSVFYFDDGSKSIDQYNANGDMILNVEYDAEGNIVYQTDYEYKYDDNGQTIFYKAYRDGKVVEDFEYQYGEDGLTYASKMTFINDDGSTTVQEYNSDLTPIKETYFDAEGNITHQVLYSYEYNENGDMLSESCTANGELQYENKMNYDGEGNYLGDTLTTYNEDGTVTVEITDEYWNLITATTYDAEGNVLEVIEGDDIGYSEEDIPPEETVDLDLGELLSEILTAE